MADPSDLAYALGGYGKRSSRFDARRKLAYAMAQQGADYSPIQSPWQGAARLGSALVGALGMYTADRDEKSADALRNTKLAEAMAEPDPQKKIGLFSAIDPEMGMRFGGQLAIEQAKQQQQQAALKSGAANFGSAYGPPQGPQQATGMPTPLQPRTNASAIGGIESGGQPNGGYGAVGPPANAQGHRAYGKYQVLETNIGPWTQEILGKAMSPQEFLANPDAQNKVFEAKFGQYVTKYGSPQAASRAWFAGEGGMNNPNAKDVNGMTVARYEDKFNQGLGGPQQAAPGVPGPIPQGPQIAQAPLPPPQGQPPQVMQGGGDGTPPAPSPNGINGPAVIAPPGVPDVPRPQPSPQQIQQYQQRIASGEFGVGPEATSKARAALDADLDRQWAADRERRFKEFDQQSGDYRATRDQQAKAPQEAFSNEKALRNEFETQPAVKSYRVVVPMMESAKDAATRPTRAADLNLVYAFAKLMDPDSVVRESETGAVVATQSVADRLQAYLGQLNGQAMLNPETRAKLLAELDSRFTGIKASHDALAEQYGSIAQAHGLTPGRVVIPIRTGREGSQAQGNQPSQDELKRWATGGQSGGPVRIGLDGRPK